ncbi:hypothetical protein GDO81_015543 [Engystomops pustulosus]|uniref:Uncharacterized protein n=1 Tax=Engystomops pustulosus TaxID=76066 RepID=A0AAV7AKU7_ENGPU|nr:hypothetical protein GDO81_015543 [Engystomops pustulosus]
MRLLPGNNIYHILINTKRREGGYKVSMSHDGAEYTEADILFHLIPIIYSFSPSLCSNPYKMIVHNSKAVTQKTGFMKRTHFFSKPFPFMCN